MMTFDELWDLLTTQDESQQIEVKRGSEIGKSCSETICAFANEPGMGGGYLILGITAPTNNPSRQYEIVGINDPDKLQQDFINLCNTSFNLPLRPQLKIETREGKNILIAHIPEAFPIEKPIFIQKRGLSYGTFRRIGSADVRCIDRDLELLYQERQNQSYDKTPVAEATLDDLDPSAITAYRQARAKLNPSATELNWSDQDLLYSLNVITHHPQNPQSYCPTVAGLILFGKAIALRRYFPMHRIDYIVTSDNKWVTDPDERYQAVTEIREPLLLGIPRLVALIINDLPKAFHLEENSLQRQDIPLIPNIVIREAIPNAVMHRNYRAASPIQIIRFADRLEIHNPGYSLKPVDEIDQPGSLTRNETVAAVLHEIRMAETKGTGGRTMIESMLEANLTLPGFDSNRQKDHFCLTLWTHHLIGEEDTQWLAQFRDFNLANDEAKALVLLRKIKRIDNVTYRIANSVDTLTASKKLIRLRDIGLLEPNGGGRSTFYTLSPKYNLSGELHDSNLESSTRNADLPGELSASSLETSSGQDTLPGELPDSNLESSTSQPTQLELGFLPGIIPAYLQNKIMSLRGRRNTSKTKELILEICKIQPQSSNELASLLSRNQKYLLDKYLKPLLEEGLLQFTLPDRPNDPQQRYRIPLD